MHEQTAPDARVVAVDALRGFALFGIVVVHFVGRRQPFRTTTAAAAFR